MRIVAIATTLVTCGCSFVPGRFSTGDGDDAGMDGSTTDVGLADQGTRRRITITQAPTADLVDVPIVLALDPTRIEYADTAPGGADLRFVDDEGTVLAHEIERWSVNGVSWVWVKVPLISATTPTGFWMYYADADAIDGQQPAAVWTASYVAVWHLGETVTDEATNGMHVDATGHGNTGAQRRNRSASVAGGIGDVQDFDGAGDYVEVAPTGLSITGSEITIEARALSRSEPTAWPHVVGGGSDGRYWQVFWDPGGQGWCNRYQVSGAKLENWTAAGSLNTWATIASVYDGTAARLYVDGQPVQSMTGTGTLDALSRPLAFGANLDLVPRDFDGLIDEVRISSVARSATWLHIQHLSMTDALLSFGPPEPI